MNQQATMYSKGKDWLQYTTTGFIKYILLPALLIYANNMLETIYKGQDKLTKKQENLVDKVSELQLSLVEYKTAHDKDRELFEFRLNMLENQCDKLYNEVYSKPSRKWDARKNASRVVK